MTLMSMTLIFLLIYCAMANTPGPAQVSAVPVATIAAPARSAVSAPGVELTLQFASGVPATLEIVRLARPPGDRLWHVAAATRAEGPRSLPIEGPPGVETLLLVRSAGHAGYLLDGPFRWPAAPATHVVPAYWVKTVRGHSMRTPAIGWIDAGDETTGAPPLCDWISEEEWECIRVPLRPGVVIMSGAGVVRYGIATGALSTSGAQLVVSRSSGWGRVIIVSGRTAEDASEREERVTVRRLQVPRARPQSTRLEPTADDRVSVEKIAKGALWVSGAGASPDEGWIEISAQGMATARVDLVDVRNGPAEVPMRIRVEPALAISGSVSASGGTPAGRALVTLYRFHGDDHAPPRPAKRVFVAEITAGEDGSFRFDDLAREPYEIVAMHSMLGRGVRRVEPDGQDVTITLRRPSRAIGRVVRDGIGVVGVHVAIVPDLGQFAAAGDITELRGGETRTDRDGRFVVLLASHGSGELRVGDEGTGVRRVPLGPAESQPAVIDVGTIELSSLPPLTLVLEASEGCDLLLVGPAGRTGMTVVRSTRVGPAMYHALVPEAGWWNVVAACNGRERAVVPANIEVDGRARDPTIRLTWPR